LRVRRALIPWRIQVSSWASFLSKRVHSRASACSSSCAAGVAAAGDVEQAAAVELDDVGRQCPQKGASGDEKQVMPVRSRYPASRWT
jgi:hypothetical protein